MPGAMRKTRRKKLKRSSAKKQAAKKNALKANLQNILDNGVLPGKLLDKIKKGGKLIVAGTKGGVATFVRSKDGTSITATFVIGKYKIKRTFKTSTGTALPNP